jgi:hypothetical protein
VATTTGLTLVKRFDYRGNTQEEFSNKYWFKGSPPGDDASWNVLLTDLLNIEKTIFPVDVQYVRAYGYDDSKNDANHVFAHDWDVNPPNPTGSFLPVVDSIRMAGDQAALAWWLCARKSRKGKPIYLRKYFHAGYVEPGGGDDLSAQYHAALSDILTPIAVLHGGLTAKDLPDYHGEEDTGAANDNIINGGANPYVTTRTLKRRGKRPRPSN